VCGLLQAAFQQAASEFEGWFVEELFLFYQHKSSTLDPQPSSAASSSL